MQVFSRFIRIIRSSRILNARFDMMNRVITQETLTTSSGHTMTDLNSTSERCFSEAIVETIIAILDQKFRIDDSQLMRQFLLRLEASIELHPDNKKLAQILLLLVTKHSVDLLQELQYVKEIAEKTKTFLKQTVLSHIANLEGKKPNIF